MPRFLLHIVLGASILRAPGRTSAASPDAVRINEISDKGTASVCSGNDWIELHLPSSASNPVNLAGYVLHDNKGPDDDESFSFVSTSLDPGEYLLLCAPFGIGGDDQVSLLDPSGVLVSTTGALSERGEFGVSFAYDDATGKFVYTATPTPDDVNIITPLPEPETLEDMRTRLNEQNDEGMLFFNMDGKGHPVEGGFDEIVDLRMKMDRAIWEQMKADQSYEVYSPFVSATVTEKGMPGKVLLNLTSPGRIRPKGQSTLAFGTCMDKSIPYSIDWDFSNAEQTLFGVQRSYLRTHLGDFSFVREWASYRMLARFGLPHLRTRTVRFFVNGAFIGVYELMEAPDQNYMFQRSFPNYDPMNFALFKVKTFSFGCGMYEQVDLAKANARINEKATPPYSFERGDHRKKMPVLGFDIDSCAAEFGKEMLDAFEDVCLAYVRYSEDCGEMLVDEGLIDRGLGVKAHDQTMKSFINSHLADNKCDEGCLNSDLPSAVDVTNFLRNFAVMAATLNSDSPLGNGNNYYLAYPGTRDTRWSIVQYDLNNILSTFSADLCDSSCLESLVHWSIVRPTCGAFEWNQMAGPLLSNNAFLAQYLEYVREFVTTVMTDPEFIAQVRSHLEAIRDEVNKDPWNDVAFLFHLELDDDDDGAWLHEVPGFPIPYMPFLPALRERAAGILEQLEAIDSRSFPRDLDDIKMGEVCVDWRSDGPRESACPEGCLYDGCFRPEFTLPSFCDETTGTCIHGVADEKCRGIDNLEGYDGMERLEGSNQPAFCWFDVSTGRPLRMAECPSPPPINKTNCHEGCSYDGCLRQGFTVPSYCDEQTGLCYHGVSDPLCEDIANTQGYLGIEGFEGSDKPAFCWLDDRAGPLRMAECPDPKFGQTSPGKGEEGGSGDGKDGNLTSTIGGGDSAGVADVVGETSSSTGIHYHFASVFIISLALVVINLFG